MKFLKRFYYHSMRSIVTVISKAIGKIRMPFSKKETTYDDVVAILDTIQIGDLILTHTDGELTTLVIPGHWKHCAIYIGDGKIIEAASPCVRESYLANLIMKTDNFCVLRMKYLLLLSDRRNIVSFLQTMIGTPYDYSMNFEKVNSVSCSELAYYAYNKVAQRFMELRDRLGFDTVTPSDFYDAKSKFTVIIEK